MKLGQYEGLYNTIKVSQVSLSESEAKPGWPGLERWSGGKGFRALSTLLRPTHAQDGWSAQLYYSKKCE